MLASTVDVNELSLLELGIPSTLSRSLDVLGEALVADTSELSVSPVVVLEEIIDSVVVPGASELVTIVDEGSVVLEDTISGEAESGVGERVGCDELADVELELSES